MSAVEETRLLLVKRESSAHQAENSRIALTVLAEDGWSVEQVGFAANVELVGVPIAAFDRDRELWRLRLELRRKSYVPFQSYVVLFCVGLVQMFLGVHGRSSFGIGVATFEIWLAVTAALVQYWMMRREGLYGDS